MKNEKASLIIESERLKNFLENNQLIQANAIVVKLESMLQQILAESKPDSIETHPCWRPFKSSMRIKRDILSGKKDEAFNEAIELSNMLSLMTGEPK